MADKSLTTAQVRAYIREGRTQFADVNLKARIRRQLIMRNDARVPDNLTGTYLPAPFDKTALALKTMIGEVAKANQHYASRIAANTPKVSIEKLSTNDRVTSTVAKKAGDQERLDMQLWEEAGGRAEQWVIGMHGSQMGVGYYLTLPRDANFGLPDRTYYEAESNEELDILRNAGKVTPYRVMRSGSPKLVYAEPNDVWAARRQGSSRSRAESGRSLFTLEALPRDQVMVWRDQDGIKAACIIREIPGTDCAAGESIPTYYAKKQGKAVTETENGETYHYGIWLNAEGKVVGGIEKGGPPETSWQRPNSFSMIQFINREEQVVLISGLGAYDGATEVYRGKHGAKRQGVPACPVVEVPMMRTGINVPGHEFTTPMEPVFAYAPLINQMLTILSNDTAYNGIPRWVVELKDGTTLRGDDGEPQTVDNGPVPGLDPSQAAAYPGTLRQLLVDTKSMQELLSILYDRLEACLPAPVSSGVAGASAAAWQVRQLVQQAQETLRQSVDNHASAVKEVMQLWHGWLRDLDVIIYFFPAPGERGTRAAMHGLIEFDPKDLTDAISVIQELDTPDEATVLLQQGIELYQGGFIDLEEFYEKYAREQDVRDAVKRNYKRQIKDYIWTGALPPLPPGAQPGSLPMVKIIGDGVRGQVFYELIQQSPHYADTYANNMASEAQAQYGATQPGATSGAPQGATTGPPGENQPPGGDVSGAAGVSLPGMGQAPTLPQQTGTNGPSMTPPAPVVS